MRARYLIPFVVAIPLIAVAQTVTTVVGPDRTGSTPTKYPVAVSGLDPSGKVAALRLTDGGAASVAEAPYVYGDQRAVCVGTSATSMALGVTGATAREICTPTDIACLLTTTGRADAGVGTSRSVPQGSCWTAPALPTSCFAAAQQPNDGGCAVVTEVGR
jgi:hypothetical protein